MSVVTSCSMGLWLMSGSRKVILDYGWEDGQRTAKLLGDMGITEKLSPSIFRISHVSFKTGPVVPKKQSNWTGRIDKFEPAE